MAINFAGLLGGLGTGAQQLAAQQEQQRQFDINKLFAERTFQESITKRKQDFGLAQQAADRLDAAQRRAERQQSAVEAGRAYEVVRSIIADELRDEQTTYGEMAQPGLQATDIEEMRRLRAERRAVRESQLKGYQLPDFVNIYGDPLAMLPPSKLVSAGYRPPVALKPLERLQVFDASRKRISEVPDKDKASVWAGEAARISETLGLPLEDVRRSLRAPGEILTPGVTTTRKRVAQPGELLAGTGEAPAPGIGFKPMETLAGGATVRRTVLPSGEIQLEETTAPVRESYASKEMDDLRERAQALNNALLEGTVQSKIRSGKAAADLAEIKARIAGKEEAWYDRTADARIKKLLATPAGKRAANASKTGIAEAMSIKDMVAVFNANSLASYRDAVLWDKDQSRRTSELNRIQSRIDKLKSTADAAEFKSAEAKSMGDEVSRRSAAGIADRLRKEAADLEKSLEPVRTGNAAGMAAVAGVPYADTRTMGRSGLETFLSIGQQRLNQMATGGVLGSQQGQQQAPQQQAPNIIVAPQIGIPGQQVAAPGYPGLPGGAAGSWWPGGGGPAFDPNSGGAVIPAGRLDQVKAAFPFITDKTDPGLLERSIGPDGKIDPAQRRLLEMRNEQLKKAGAGKKEDKDKPKPSLVDPVIAAKQKALDMRRTGYYYAGTTRPYSGDVYSGYPMGRGEYEARIRAKKPLGPRVEFVDNPRTEMERRAAARLENERRWGLRKD